MAVQRPSRISQEGANVVLDGSNVTVPGFENGNFVGASVIAGVKPNMTCYKVYFRPTVSFQRKCILY